MRVLILAESDGQIVSEKTLPSIAFAQSIGAEFDILAFGEQGIDRLQGYGAGRAIVVQNAGPPLSGAYAKTIALVAEPYDIVVGTTSTYTRDVLARAAALLDWPIVSDVIQFEASERVRVKRPIYSANLIGTFEIDAPRFAMTARGPAWGKPESRSGESQIERISLQSDSDGTRYIGLEQGAQGRPDLTQARVVVSGGRPLKDAETFEKLIGGLADVLGGAVGATRAAVDSGIAPNDLQVGQTGKTVAPELYIAVAVSGSVQHLAGMKDSKVIVAINTDPEAPIYDVADFGLVMDLYQAVPEMIEELKRLRG
ncbi:MAG: electron transfer flavoprotein subunit alpha/FixB family protein [Armatimonadetes bacterium]|nr:electron transfer flavoprotein subunit alpha/FixB family protein [Armatimonadota bacterium]